MLPVQPKSTAVITRSSLYGDATTRFVAFLIDSTLLVFFFSISFYSADDHPELMFTWNKHLVQSNLSPAIAASILKSVFLNPYFLVMHWLYYTLLEASPRQATIGKFVLGLQVSDLRGKKMNLLKSNYRYIVKLLLSAPLFLGFLLVINKRRKQTLYDFIARTVVTTSQTSGKSTNTTLNHLKFISYN
ncbi:RDD family protein [Pontibacter beigongshangensis]|uniref:RDD family protein n=1 Tax=Pontibacter beigongshangensis TaxID=2574733 RepID=UPI00164FC4DD|nr:RDD family protein [Pontibacter beigongshangensis]